MKKSKHPIRFGLGILFLTTTLLVLFFACSSPDNKQVDITEESRSETEATFEVVEVMPEYPGGMEALIEYLGSNIKYPEEAKNENIEGKVFVNFIVEKDGSIGETTVLRGIGGGCDEEAVRVVNNMPDWTPGTQRGEPVKVSYNLPINFALDNDDKKVTIINVIDDTDPVFTLVEVMPEFPGGKKALMQYLAENITYPAEAKKEGVQGRVFINFTIEKNGKVNDVKVLRGIGSACDEEALRVVRSLPDWKPGLQDGIPVRVFYNLPIKFALN